MTKTKQKYVTVAAIIAVMAAAVLTVCGFGTSAKAAEPIRGDVTLAATSITKMPAADSDFSLSLSDDLILSAGAPALIDIPVSAFGNIGVMFQCGGDGTSGGSDVPNVPADLKVSDLPLTLDVKPLISAMPDFVSGTTFYIQFMAVGAVGSDMHYLFSDKLSFVVVERLTLPETPTKEGHTFTGWYMDEACTEPYDGRPITEETTLYAGWEINRYTVTFNVNGGQPVEPVTTDWNTVPTLPTPTREGHDFLGWYNGNEPYAEQPVTQDITLVALWQIKTFTVTFMNGAEIVATVTVEYGQSFEVAMKAANLQYFNLLNAAGEVTSKGERITGDVTAVVKEMTRAEKVGAFFANNWWILVVAGCVILFLFIALLAATRRRRR